MESTGTTEAEPGTIELLVQLLKGAEQAHGQYERQLGKRDDDWPEWYARHMARALGAAGYRIGRGP